MSEPVAPAPVSEREERILGIIETARGKRGKFRDAHITMSHGAGGKATQSLIEGLFLPAFVSGTLEAMGDSGLFDLPALTRLADEHAAGAADHSQALWQLLVMEGFLAQAGHGAVRDEAQLLGA